MDDVLVPGTERLRSLRRVTYLRPDGCVLCGAMSRDLRHRGFVPCGVVSRDLRSRGRFPVVRCHVTCGFMAVFLLTRYHVI